MPALAYNIPLQVHSGNKSADFKHYLEHSLNSPFILDLKGYDLMDVIQACITMKSRLKPKYGQNLSCLVYNLNALEEEYQVRLKPAQITDIFWSYFVSFCQDRGLKASTITTVCNQLRSVLNWAVKYNADISPTYCDVIIPKIRNQKIALTADEVSRIAYFDIQRFYADRRKDLRETLERVRDMFVLSCNLFQRHSDMIRIDKSCFDRNIFRIIQQKTGNIAIVNIDKYAIDAKTTYRILEKYNYEAPYKGNISNYNDFIHMLMRDIRFDEPIRIEEKINGEMVITTLPKWKLITSHTARRTAITVNVLRGNNIHDLKKCSGHTDLRIFDNYIRDEQ